MNNGSDYSLESRHRFIKQQISTLGYDYEFSNDALPLLENLVTDLLQTTDNLKHFKDLSRHCLEACHDLETFLDAYKKDNAWLVQELNTLHLNTLSAKLEYENRIAELTRSAKTSEATESTGYVKHRSRSCLKQNEKSAFSSSRNEISNLKELIKNKDSEIKHLQNEILRLNDLLSNGRPLEAILKDSSCNYQFNKLKDYLNKTIASEHEAKRNAIRLAEFYDHQPDSTNDAPSFCENDVQWISENSKKNTSDKLKTIEQELNKLKAKYQKLEINSKPGNKQSETELEESKSKEITTLKDKCRNLEEEKTKLLDELEKLKTSYENIRSTCSKVEKALVEARRSCQELSADKSDRDKFLKKCQEEKRHFLSRIQELSIIERDLTLEVTRLCNVNAVHKRHILELENKLLEVSVSKGKAALSSLKPDIIKKPLERKIVQSTRNKENITDFRESNIDKEKVTHELSKIREKYNKQIEKSKIDHESRSACATEFQKDQDNAAFKSVTFIDDIKSLNEKVDSLTNVLVEKEKTLSNLVAENQKLNNAFTEINLQNAARKKVHACDQCTFAEKLISEYKEKLVTLEADKRELLVRHSECPKIIDCNKQHIMQLRSDLHNLQLELQHYKTNFGKYNRLEEETNFTVESSKAVQKQLEMQLEASQKKVQLLEKDYNTLKSELLSLRDAKLKLQKSVIDMEVEKDQLATSVEEKMKKMNVLEKLLKSRDVKLSNLEHLVDEQQKQLNSGSSKVDSKKVSASIEHLRGQIKNLEKSKEQTLAENRRLERQLTELRNDHATCQRDLKKAKSEAELLKTQVHEYIGKVKAAEDTLQEKSKERSDMLDHFRTLTLEATQLESNNQTLESEARSTRNALRNAESKITDLEHIIQNKDALIAGYEEQLEELTKTIASLETKIVNLTDQRDRLQAELDSSELLSGRLDDYPVSSPTLQPSNKNFRDEISRLLGENRRMMNALSREKYKSSAHESGFSVSQNEPSDANITSIELQEEIRGLKANIKCLQESLETTSKQLRKTQNEAADYQKQVIQLNRELRSLQFECVRNASDHSINYTTL